jgi:tetratricopeptide (TPR) repeat protein
MNTPSDGRRHRWSRGRIRWWVLASGIPLAILMTYVLLRAVGVAGSGPSAATEPRSVAVLTFAESGGADGFTLADNLATRIRTALSYVPGLDLRPRLAPSPGGRGSGAGVVVDGDIRHAGSRVHVEARLLDGGEVRWRGSWDRPAGDPADLADELSLLIADGLRLTLAPYVPHEYTENERAYDRFLDGVYAHRRFTPKDIWTALQYYREAWEQDPDFALAHAIAGNAYIHLSLLDVSPRISLENARAQALEALAIDSTLAEGYAALGYVQIWGERNYDAGERSLRRAIMLYPGLPQARDWYGRYALYFRGWDETGVSSERKALELDPLNTGRSFMVEWVLYYARRYDQVEEQDRVTRALGADQGITMPESPLGEAYRELGRYEESVAEFRALQERTGGPPPSGLAITYHRMGRDSAALAIVRERMGESEDGGDPTAVARALAGMGDADGAFRWLDQAYIAEPSELLTLRVDAAFDPIRADPRFDRLLRRLGMEP